MIQLLDLCATILAAAGLLTEEVQRDMPESHNLLPLAEGRVERVRDTAVCTYRNTGIFNTGRYPDPPTYATMLREGHYKLNVYLPPRGRATPLEGQLFDLAADPDELRNLWNVADHREARLHLTDRLLEWETRQELLLGSRGGEMFPSRKQRLNNRLKQ